MQIGKKKLVLDHLIVQKMDEDDDSPGENIQSILTYGAQALFSEESSVKDIVYSDQDIDKLIEKTETEGDESDKPKEGGLSFEFAKVWATDRNDLDEIADDDQVDSWAQTLQKINEEKAKVMAQEQTASGRGARRKAATAAKVGSLSVA
jgi:chromodomain-helicase-DNA-binding protein 4